MALVKTSRDFQTGHESTSVSLGLVTSITRDGEVKAWDNPFATRGEARSNPVRLGYGDRVLVVAATSMDVAAAMDAYRHHTWAGHDQIKPFDSVEECRDFLLPFRKREPQT